MFVHTVNIAANGDGVVIVFIKGVTYTISSSQPKFKKVVSLLSQKNDKELEKLLTQKTEVPIESLGGFSEIKDYIDNLLSYGLDAKPIELFMANLAKNPFDYSREALYKFLMSEGLPITTDGYCLGYKAVTASWMDKHTRTIRNMIGDNPEINIKDVDPNTLKSCSKGLHIGNHSYVQDFATLDDKKIIVKFSPEHVIAIPKEANQGKIRVYKYSVIAEYTGKFQEMLYSSALVGINSGVAVVDITGLTPGFNVAVKTATHKKEELEIYSKVKCSPSYSSNTGGNSSKNLSKRAKIQKRANGKFA